MRAIRHSLLAAALGLGAATLFIPTTSYAQQAADLCEELEEATRSATEEAIEKVRNSEHYEEVKDERMSSFDCQMAVAGELSSWVKGDVGMGFLDRLFGEMTDYVSKKSCDEMKARARQANSQLGDLDKIVKDLPASLEEAQKLAEESAQRAAEEYAKQRVDEYMDKLPPTPHVQTPGYNPVNVTPSGSDPWGAIRNLWGTN